MVRTRIFGTLGALHARDHRPRRLAAVRWGAAAAFPGLLAGERLRRVHSAPARGTLLARDGTPLGDLVSASNVIGTVGEATAPARADGRGGFPATTAVGLDGLESLFQRQLGGRPGGT